MIREQAIITMVKITKAAQVKNFQVKLPKNSKRIIGIETGVRFKVIPIVDGADGGTTIPPAGHLNSLITFNRNMLIGELKLQSCEEANIFFATHVQSDKNIGAGDFSQNGNWKAELFSHQTKSNEDIVIVDGDSTILQGIFKDRVGEQSNADHEYTVKVYVWIEIEEPQTEKGETP